MKVVEGGDFLKPINQYIVSDLPVHQPFLYLSSCPLMARQGGVPERERGGGEGGRTRKREKERGQKREKYHEHVVVRLSLGVAVPARFHNLDKLVEGQNSVPIQIRTWIGKLA